MENNVGKWCCTPMAELAEVLWPGRFHTETGYSHRFYFKEFRFMVCPFCKAEEMKKEME